MQAPKAERIPHPHKLHGDVRPDDYYWLREKQNPAVIRYLEAENAYFDEHMKPLRPLQNALYDDMLKHIPEADEEIPARQGPFFYYSRINPDQQYRTYYRRRAASRAELSSAPEEIILDVNGLAREGEFLDVSTVRVSPSHELMAYLVNRDGTDRYTLLVQDLKDGRLLDAPIENVFIGGSVVWDATSRYLFYLTVDDSQRPYRLWRHKLGEDQDVLLHQEDDIAFTQHLSKTRDGAYVLLTTAAKTSSEVRFLAADKPEDEWRLFAPRRPNVLYELEHWNGQFLNLTNDGAENFTILAVSDHSPDPAEQRPLFPYDASRYLQGVLPFQAGLVLSGRSGGLTQIWVYKDGALQSLTWDEPLYTVYPRSNLDFETREVLLQYQSPLTPKTDYAYDIVDGTLATLRQDAVRHYDPSHYVEKRLWATARDGAQIPLSLVARRESLDKTPAPLILYGYGSYGANSDPAFDPARLALLDRGVIYVTAHVRGGSEMGYHWYQDGKLLKKKNTFTDFVDAAQYLVDAGYTTPEKMAARGRSAGGLLMGAILNLRPDLFKVVVPGVPFVDVVTTMLDASIPLTSLEWDEWGNPADPEYYAYMKSYSPYDNIEAKDYPHMLVYTGLNDPRVGYFEPAKWVARMRELKTDQNQLLLKTHMGAGHGGSSGRLARLKEQAEEYAFILDKLGIHA